MMEPQAHLLVVDDDERIRGLLQKFLVRNGFLVSTARDAAQARRLLVGLEFDLLVLDVMMPGEDGITLTRDLRRTMKIPILLLTAKGETLNRIEGFEAGADDYLVKPFEPKELLLRINAILRRVPQVKPADTGPKHLHLGAVRYDLERGELWRGNDLIRVGYGNDTLMGGLGTDRLSLDQIADPLGVNANLTTHKLVFADAGLIAISGFEDLQGGAFNDTLTGDAGANLILGGNGSDQVLGGAGNDTLIGGTMGDVLTGGFGNDSFVFLALADSAGAGLDTVQGFQPGYDVIDLSAIDAIPGGTDDAFVFIGAAGFTAGQAEVRTTQISGSTWVEVRLAGSVTDDMQIVLAGLYTLSDAHFVL